MTVAGCQPGVAQRSFAGRWRALVVSDCSHCLRRVLLPAVFAKRGVRLRFGSAWTLMVVGGIRTFAGCHYFLQISDDAFGLDTITPCKHVNRWVAVWTTARVASAGRGWWPFGLGKYHGVSLCADSSKVSTTVLPIPRMQAASF